MKINKLALAIIIISSSLLLSSCGPKKNSAKIAPTPTPRLIELSASEKPYVSLIPRADGHSLKFKIDRIPSGFSQIEYELIYTAVDQGNEIEKGLGDTIQLTGNSVEKDLLLGTESCTHGCKYKYDEGITGGTISLTLISDDDQVTTYESQFTLLSGVNFKKAGKLSVPSENFIITASPADKSEYFVAFKNYGIPAGTSAKESYSVFSSGKGKGTVTQISPASATNDNKSQISGDYLVL